MKFAKMAELGCKPPHFFGKMITAAPMVVVLSSLGPRGRTAGWLGLRGGGVCGALSWATAPQFRAVPAPSGGPSLPQMKRSRLQRL